jgi:hypothetical protein
MAGKSLNDLHRHNWAGKIRKRGLH